MDVNTVLFKMLWLYFWSLISHRVFLFVYNFLIVYSFQCLIKFLNCTLYCCSLFKQVDLMVIFPILCHFLIVMTLSVGLLRKHELWKSKKIHERKIQSAVYGIVYSISSDNNFIHVFEFVACCSPKKHIFVC